MSSPEKNRGGRREAGAEGVGHGRDRGGSETSQSASSLYAKPTKTASQREGPEKRWLINR